VDQLIDLDVPVESVRGRYGGYRLAPGYRLPPLMLSDDEALAVLLGLVAGRRAGLTTTQHTANETASAKIRRVLPKHIARRLDTLVEALAFTDQPGEFDTPDGYRHEVTLRIHGTVEQIRARQRREPGGVRARGRRGPVDRALDARRAAGGAARLVASGTRLTRPAVRHRASG
jgi:hypothetical protein